MANTYIATVFLPFSDETLSRECHGEWDAIQWLQGQIDTYWQDAGDQITSVRVYTRNPDAWEWQYRYFNDPELKIGTVKEKVYPMYNDATSLIDAGMKNIQNALLASVVYDDHMEDIERIFLLKDHSFDKIMPNIKDEESRNQIALWFMREFVTVACNLSESIQNNFKKIDFDTAELDRIVKLMFDDYIDIDDDKKNSWMNKFIHEALQDKQFAEELKKGLQ